MGVEDDAHRARQRALAGMGGTECGNTFMRLFTLSLCLPIVVLAVVPWVPLWSKWKLCGFLGVVSAWGGIYAINRLIVAVQ
jgi:hypothetical protein